MTNLLILQNSVNLDTSVSRRLVDAFAENYRSNHPDTRIVQRDLAKEPVPHLTPSLASTQLSGIAAETAETKLSDALIQELEASDIVAIGVPLYNFTIPSTLKAWLDHVIKAHRTFAYIDGSPRGLLPEGKKVIAFVASGGAYADGPGAAIDFLAPYLRFIFGFIGITDVEIVRAELQAVPELGAQAESTALERARALAA